MYFRYRFETRQHRTENFHDKFVLLQMPYWISAEYDDGRAIVTCYLPVQQPLTYWFEDAKKIESVQCDEIAYSEHFPKPDWIEDWEV